MSTAVTNSTERVSASVARAPIIAVVRHKDRAEAARQARLFARHHLEMVEVTFTVPGATALVRELLAERPAGGPPWIGMGTVTTRERAEAAVAAGAEFIVSPNTSAEVARVAKAAGLYLVLGALTPTEIVTAHELGADLIKVYPLPPVGGPAYLSVVRQPLGDVGHRQVHRPQRRQRHALHFQRLDRGADHACVLLEPELHGLQLVDALVEFVRVERGRDPLPHAR